ncbi:hypothetical protein LPJ54_002084 [Coemansia sp. RSA 1824]|nr:hypothetical protein LPJ54_002084 [Coemansia sp. RSA 1824]
MHFAGFIVCVFAFALAAFASSVSSSEHAQEYSLELANRMAKYVAAQSRAGNQVSDICDISLTDLGLASTETTVYVRDVVDTSAPHAESSILNIPFNDVFAMQPSRVRYIARVFDVLSRVDPQFANQFARVLGVDKSALGSSENMDAVARLALAISKMKPDSLAVVSKATRVDETSDPLVKSGSLFALSNILAMQNTRVEHVARLFDSLSQLSVPQLQAYLHAIGWESTHAQKSEDSETNSIPNLSYVFPINDSLLDDMSEAAVDYSKGTIEPAAMIRTQVEEYLREARDFWDLIPGLSTVSSALNLSNSPLVSALTDIITLLYKYPNASYWELALQYFKDKGLPGLSVVSAYPSQFVGSLASQFVGGYVSNAISGVVASILGPGIASVSTTSSPSLSSPKLLSSPIPTPAAAISGTVAISPRPTPTYSKPTPAHSNALQATLNLNSNMSTHVTVAVIMGGTQAVLGALTIPGIISLDLGNGDGLKLDILGGLISANIGNHRQTGSNRGNRPAPTPLNPPAPTPSNPPAAFY